MGDAGGFQGECGVSGESGEWVREWRDFDGGWRVDGEVDLVNADEKIVFSFS